MKTEIRRLMRQREVEFLRSGSSGPESERILSNIEASSLWQNAPTVLLYMHIPGEVETSGFIARWSAVKRIVIPRVSGEELELCLYDPERLHSGYRGILEPSEDAKFVAPEEIDFALIPGVAFSICGQAYETNLPSQVPTVQRLGRGKGYYDRLLTQLNCPVAGICFPFRILPEIPTDPWDRPLDMIFY